MFPGVWTECINCARRVRSSESVCPNCWANPSTGKEVPEQQLPRDVLAYLGLSDRGRESKRVWRRKKNEKKAVAKAKAGEARGEEAEAEEASGQCTEKAKAKAKAQAKKSWVELVLRPGRGTDLL